MVSITLLDILCIIHAMLMDDHTFMLLDAGIYPLEEYLRRGLQLKMPCRCECDESVIAVSAASLASPQDMVH